MRMLNIEIFTAVQLNVFCVMKEARGEELKEIHIPVTLPHKVMDRSLWGGVQSVLANTQSELSDTDVDVIDQDCGSHCLAGWPFLGERFALLRQ
jgi:hypothetical protein